MLVHQDLKITDKNLLKKWFLFRVYHIILFVSLGFLYQALPAPYGESIRTAFGMFWTRLDAVHKVYPYLVGYYISAVVCGLVFVLLTTRITMKQYRAKPETKSVTESDNGIVVFAFLILFCAVWYVLFASIDLEGMHYKMNGLILNPIGIAICWLLLTDVLRITFVNILVSKKQ